MNFNDNSVITYGYIYRLPTLYNFAFEKDSCNSMAALRLPAPPEAWTALARSKLLSMPSKARP
jgi:hypothetical protein